MPPIPQTPPPRPPRSPRRPWSPHITAPPVSEDEEDRTLFAPCVPPVLTPLAVPTVKRVEKCKHDEVSDTEENHPSNRPRLTAHAGPPRASPQLARRSVPLPRKFVYKQRRASSAPTTGTPRFLVPYSPLPRQPPSPPDDLVHAPPLVDPDPRPPVPSHTVVEDDNSPMRGVKTLDDSVFAPVSAPDATDSCPQTPCLTPDTADSPPQTPPRVYLFPRHALEMPHDPDELVTKTSNRQRRDSTRVPYPTTPRNHDRPAQNMINHRPEDVPVVSQHMRKRCRANAAAAPPHSPGVATNAQPVDHRTRRRTTDLRSNSLDGTPAKPDSHVKPQQARPHRTPERKHIRTETTEATPAIKCANAAVEMFLRRYNADRPTPKQAPTQTSPTYDAVAQHLAYRFVTNPDTACITQPFALRPGPHK
ncbi:hypothetical protein EDB89DRAFT_2069962 [Lactarius sanguifluus]|nr:hypothetical protein EDB89DRAFT_2069962 [Lactarius sanguifluus]